MTKATPQSVARYWATRAEGYSDRTVDEFTGERGLVWETRLKEALEAAPEGPVLDLGCGPGLFTLLAARLGRRATGIDITPAMIEAARANHAHLAPHLPVDFILGNAEALPLPDHSLAAVLSRYVLWNLPHPETALKEIRRVLKPEGVLFYVDGNHYRYLTDPAWAAWHAKQPPAYGHEARFVKGVDTSPMEEMAKTLPLTNTNRPDWDEAVLTRLGFHEVHSRILSEVRLCAEAPNLVTEFSVSAKVL